MSSIPGSPARGHYDVVERSVGTAVQRQADSHWHTAFSRAKTPPLPRVQSATSTPAKIPRNTLSGDAELVFTGERGGSGRAAAAAVRIEAQLRPTWRVRVSRVISSKNEDFASRALGLALRGARSHL